jgi:hypothetical protein
MPPELDHRGAEQRFQDVFRHLGAIGAYARRRGSPDPDAVAARRANPVPHPSPVDGTALFAQITSTAPDRRLKRESPYRRRLLVTAAGHPQRLAESCRANKPG